jgi:two-component system OmpR family response regulator
VRGRLRFDRWILDPARRELVDEGGTSVALSSGEFRLLAALLERPGMVLTRDQLLDLTRGRAAQPFDRSIDNQISRLRKKIERDPRNPTLIRTAWGDGYSFAGEVTRL